MDILITRLKIMDFLFEDGISNQLCIAKDNLVY